MTSLAGTITESIFSHDVQVIGYPVLVTDSFGTPDLLSAIRAYPQTITDGIGIQDVALGRIGVVVAELLQIKDSWALNQIGHLSFVDSIFLNDAIARGLPITLTDGIGVQLVQAANQLIHVVEALGLLDIVAPLFKYKTSVSEKLSFADALTRFIGAGIIENLQVVEVLSAIALKPAGITDGVGIVTDLTSSRLILRAVTDETLSMHDAELVRMIFSGAILEGLEIAAAYLGPNGSITTWAMNTRTTAVTEYTNYVFNSFARIGDKYLGATKDGLYELTGDNDAGTNIIADLKSGLAQLSGSHMASFKAAYIAVRGGGSYVLRIYTGDGQRYDYAVTADSMKTARIDIGKGIRARYFAFELISSGQDFDLDTLEFVPLIAKRRV